MRLLYVVSEDWYFLSHRLPMARAARAAGFDVHVATRVSGGAPAIAAEGFTVHDIPFARGTLSPLHSLRTIAAIRRVYRSVAPAIVHHVALQSAVLGSLAALGHPAVAVNALTGFGYTFTSGSMKARLLRGAIERLLRLLLNRRNAVALVQNPDDREMLRSIGVADGRIVLIPGSGVDIGSLKPMPEPDGPVTIAFVGRLLDDKGIRTLIEAHRLLRQGGSNVELLIAGTPDPANPASVTEQEASGWNSEAGVTWLGQVSDIAGLWARAHIAVLPSHREGLPKSLLEAAACGRPMIATDVPGCREVVIADRTGLLVPVGDARALAKAIARLAETPALRARYGTAARELAVSTFSDTAIGRQIIELYRRACGAATA